MIENLSEISLFTQAYFTMLTTIHESKNYREVEVEMTDDYIYCSAAGDLLRCCGLMWSADYKV